MERAKYLVIIFIFCSLNTLSQISFKNSIYNSYINDDMNRWKNIIDIMKRIPDKSNEFILELINYKYGYIGWCIGNNRKVEAEKYLEGAELYLKKLEERNYDLSSIHAYKSAFYGYRIGLNRFQAPFLGPRSIENAELSVELDSTNPLGYIQVGNNYYYMPSIFGGSKTKALEKYKIAENLIKNNSKEIKNDWNYLNLLVIIAKAYTETKNYKMAKYYYEKILEIEPDFLWVKNELYPNILRRI